MTDPALPVATPVSDALERELRGELSRNGIVVWLDKDSSYTGFADRLAARRAAGEFPAPVTTFRGSFLDLLFQLESYGNGLDRQQLLVHMPGFNEESIRDTPVLELYEAGVRFRKALDTLVRETATARVTPAEIEHFLSNSPTLERADAWLEAAVSQSAVGLAVVLDELGPRLLTEALGREDSPLASRIKSDEELGVLRAYLHKLTGLDDEWIARDRGDAGEPPLARRLASLLDATGAWLLSLEYVHDLRRPPHLALLQPLRDVGAPLVKRGSAMLDELRRDYPDAYAKRADQTEALLAEELAAMSPDDLGRIDTFREEENRVLAGAVEALRAEQWQKARAWCEARVGERSFWLKHAPHHRFAWALVAEAAALGETLAQHTRPLAKARGLEEVAQRYTAGAFEVDLAHRRFEQKRFALLEPRLPHFGALQEVVTALRVAHRAWADELARDFTTVCKDTSFLPPTSLQQRTLFDDVVQPLVAAGEKTALFVIDAFRYEMATELLEELSTGGAVVDLKARFAELPTITSVGMNALAPVTKQGGRLGVAGTFEGFRSGEFTVRTPDDRARAMGNRTSGKPALKLTLTEVCEANTGALTKQLKPHGLVIIHSKELDDAGEANVGLPTFELTLQHLKSAWRHLQLAGVKNFVFTADHGFLIQDETTQLKRFGTKRSVQRRHIVDDIPRPDAGVVAVSMASLGYDGISGYLVLRDDTHVFDNGTLGATFVHGGNSLQERLIPVLVVTKKRTEMAGLTAYCVETKAMTSALGLHRLGVRVTPKPGVNTALDFAAARHLELALTAIERDAVRVVLKEAGGEGKLVGGRVRVPIGEAWTEVFFGLEGPIDERVRVRVSSAEADENVAAAEPETWFAVVGSSLRAGSAPEPRAQSAGDWPDAIEDAGVRAVFVHLARHGVIEEGEVTAMLGSPKLFRQFSKRFDEYHEKLPFRVRVEPSESGKRYVREGAAR